MSYEFIKTETKGRVGIVRLDRPKQLNALNPGLMKEVGDALAGFDVDDGIGCIVITGSEKAFAAGADIGSMKDMGFIDVYKTDAITKDWDRIRAVRKPLVAAVAGFALGGGCEVAMMCDIIVAADNAKFGQPEILLGVLPGAGGTQRLPRAVGKAKAMDLCLTGRNMGAEEAERLGLVSRVVPTEKLMEEVMALAEKIASLSVPALMMVKEAINSSFESSLSEGLRFEKRLFNAAFALDDRREGMAAFIEKRKADFRHR